MTVLFSVNTEKVRLRRGEFSGGLREAGGCGTARGCSPGAARLRQTVREPCQGRVGAASGAAAGAAPGGSTGTPKCDSLHPDGMCLRGGAGKGGAAPGCEGNQSLDQKARGDPRSGVHREGSLQHFLVPAFNDLAEV